MARASHAGCANQKIWLVAVCIFMCDRRERKLDFTWFCAALSVARVGVFAQLSFNERDDLSKSALLSAQKASVLRVLRRSFVMLFGRGFRRRRK